VPGCTSSLYCVAEEKFKMSNDRMARFIIAIAKAKAEVGITSKDIYLVYLVTLFPYNRTARIRHLCWKTY